MLHGLNGIPSENPAAALLAIYNVTLWLQYKETDIEEEKETGNLCDMHLL